MKRIYSFIRSNLILIFILLLASYLRFSGIIPSYPPYHSDEGMSYSQAISNVREKTLDGSGYPIHYAYPSLVPIINMLFFKFFFIPLAWFLFYIKNFGLIIDGFMHIPLSKADYQRIFELSILGEREIHVLFWGRIITALFGVLVALLTYIFARDVFNKKVGLLSAFLVAINYRQVLNSHLDLPDIYNAFFLLLSLIFSFALIKKPTRKQYVLAGAFAGLFFSTKFQIYSFISLTLAHFYSALEKRQDKKSFVKMIISSKLMIAYLVALIIILVLNPYHFIHFEETREQLADVSRKYQMGQVGLYIYPFVYLYFVGIGRALSLFAIAGMLFSLIMETKKSFFVLSSVLPFFYILTYYSKGGFYTRNFVTITPLLLIFSGYFLYVFYFYLTRKVKRFALFLLIIVLGISSRDNIINSKIVGKTYREEWNYKVLANWLSQNLPSNSKISAHPSVPLPIEGVRRLPYEFSQAFSLNEFAEDGADYAIANLDWVTSDFYWWMVRSYFKKPVHLLEFTYPGMSTREMSDFAIYEVVNPWQAPDSNFIVSVVPRYSIKRTELVTKYGFEMSDDSWQKKGLSNTNGKGLIWQEGQLIINSENSGMGSWESEPIEIDDWKAFVIEYKIKTESINPRLREGFISVMFYNFFEDAQADRNRIAVRLSERNKTIGEWVNKRLIGEIPANAKYMKVGFHSYEPTQAKVSLDSLQVYKAEVEADFDRSIIKPFKLDKDVLYPYSHGYL